jgi:hypothetical protein
MPYIERRVLVSRAALVLLLVGGTFLSAFAQTADQPGAKHPGFRLRSFFPNASGSMYFSPSPAGGVVRVTALGLPAPNTLMPNAHVYVVWASATGAKPTRVGELHTDEAGNGGLEFARPEGFEKYSVIVTAEPSVEADYPSGVMALASWGGAVSASYGEPNNTLADSRKRLLERELKGTGHEGANTFNAEVESALRGSEGEGRTLQLQGNEAAPEAYGIARIAARDEKIYLHTVIKQLPLPSQVGANIYVLWGIVHGGRITYMGSLPTLENREADEFVRVNGFSSSDIDLAVSAELRRPAFHPSGLRTLSTASETQPDSSPAFGAVEGRVVDADGHPVVGATVEVGPVDQPVVPGTLPRTTTDQQGNFFLDGVPPGTHMIYASKETEGYPSPYLAFFGVGNTATPKVTVENKQVTEKVEVRLGPKAASLGGEIKDADTHQPVDSAEIILSREDNPENYFSFGPSQDGKFQRLIPPAPLRMKVSAPGYEDWYYGKDGSKGESGVIKVEPNTSKDVEIALRRVKRE